MPVSCIMYPAPGGTMHPYKRSARVNDLIREEIAEIIMHKIRDPRIGFVTVTGVNVSNDLRHAKVYVSILEDTKRDETIKVLNSSAKFIRGELGTRIRMKFIPQIVFQLDESVEYGAKIERILNDIKSQQEHTPVSEGEAAKDDNII